MDYDLWRKILLTQDRNADPVTNELPIEFYEVESTTAIDFIDKFLTDPIVHQYDQHNIDYAIQTIYNNCCSDLPFCYVGNSNPTRTIEAIHNLGHLYQNFFNRYCINQVKSIGNDIGGPLSYICYMFWDIFVLYPGNTNQAGVDAGVKVMSQALNMDNEECIISALHGLGHWVDDSHDAKTAIFEWLKNPTTDNDEIICYAEKAKTGYIL